MNKRNSIIVMGIYNTGEPDNIGAVSSSWQYYCTAILATSQTWLIFFLNSGKR